MIQTIVTHTCPKCGSENLVRNGHDYKGDQKYHCKSCASYGTLHAQRGYDERLRKQVKRGIIVGELDAAYETRPRKMYSLTPDGESLLAEWLRAALTKFDVTEERDITLVKFLFAEGRLSPAEMRDWLAAYEAALDNYEYMFRTQRDPESGDWSPHQHMVVAAMLMEIDMQRRWIIRAREHLGL